MVPVVRKKRYTGKRTQNIMPSTTSLPFSVYIFVGIFALQLLILVYLYHSNRVMLKIVESQNEILKALVRNRCEH